MSGQASRMGPVLVSMVAAAWAGAAEAPPAPAPGPVAEPAPALARTLDVADVWAGHPVGFCLLTHGDRQFAAFYDAERRLTVASRGLEADTWALTRLPTAVGWDSHNYVTLAVDDGGFLHLSGNMHCVPLIYFRSTRPLDAGSFEAVPSMVGPEEKRCTYPVFFRGPANELIFTYRDGGSGNGNQIYNAYDLATRSWHRLLDRPLTDGEGQRNAYLSGPTQGADGWWHLVWVWRETPDCATNHDLSYARSRDLVHWETSAGRPLALPITLATAEIVDPVPVGGGIINGNTRLGFDSQKRPVIAYHKHDEKGHTQVYNARLEGARWVSYRMTDWDWRWDFSGGGSIGFDIHVEPVRLEADGALTQGWRSAKAGGGTWRLDEATLKPLGEYQRRPTRPAGLDRLESTVAGMSVRWCTDSGHGPDPTLSYALRWEALGPNRDRPRESAPPPARLRLCVFRQPAPPPAN